jgi:hypothetical protein
VGRLHLIEIQDQRWFPNFLRDHVTDGLQFIFDLVNLYRPIAGRLRNALDQAGTHHVVDLCSGAGGPWPRLCQVFEQERVAVDVSLTDKHPNARAAKQARDSGGCSIRFHAEPVDAIHIPVSLAGFRTMFTSFHHFRPAEARTILQDAVAKNQGIGIFEVPKRSAKTILLVFLVPIGYLLSAPFMRPLQWSRLLFTYLVPVVPAVLWFDGIVSCLRAYSPPELLELTHGLSENGYRWQSGEQRGEGAVPATVTYLIGYPTAEAHSNSAVSQ